VPSSTLIQVEATGPNERDAVALANSGSESLIRYVQRIEKQGGAREALATYRRNQARVVALQRRVQSLSRPAAARKQRAKLQKASVDLEAAKLEAENSANLFRAAEGAAPASASLSLIAPAADARSDYRDKLQQLILLGIAAGLVLGLALALLRANRGVLRSMRE
jgi:hypothetical protein